MKPGNFVLDLLSEAPKTGRTIVLIRHSKRDSFEGIPDHLREGVEITPEGIRMARSFGESLGEIAPGRHLSLGHTVAHRCRMTALSIAEGYSPSGPVRILGCHPEIESPVVHHENYIALRNTFGWRELIRKWLDYEIPDTAFRDPRRYSDTILEKLLLFPQTEDGDLLVAVAHDVTLFPILFSVFGKKVKPVDFLNGIVISANGTTAEIHYRDSECSLSAELEIPPISRNSR